MQQIGPEHRNLLTRYSDIRKRLMGSRRVIKKPPVAVIKPLWVTTFVRFDAHIKDYRMYGARDNSFNGLTIIDYIKFRCSEEGYIFADVMSRSRIDALVKQRRKLWVELSARGLSASKIAHIFGLDHSTVLFGLQKEDPENRAGRISPKKVDLTAEEELNIVNHYKELKVASHVAKYFRLSGTTLTKILAKHGVPKGTATTTVDRFDVFKPEQGKLIKAMYEDGFSHRLIAREIGLSTETIRVYIKAKGIVKGVKETGKAA